MDKILKLQNCNRLTYSLLLFFYFGLHIQPIVAQDSLAVDYSINARGTFKEGQLNQIILSSDGYYAVTSQYWKTELFANYSYLKTNGRLGENEFLGRAMVSLFPQKRWFPVIGYIYNKSEFYKIGFRHAAGLGIGCKVIENESTSINFYAWTAYDQTDFINTTGYNTFRINTFLVGNHQLVENILSLQYTLFYLQSLEQSDNYIWRIKPSLSVQLSRKFSLTINLQSHFENIIDPTNTRRNSEMTVGFKFQNI